MTKNTFLLLIIILTTQLNAACQTQVIPLPKGLILGQRGYPMASFNDYVQTYLYEIEDDLNLSKITFTGTAGGGYGNGSNMIIDFAIYDLSGSIVYSEEGGTNLTSSTYRGQTGSYIKLSYELKKAISIKKGRYYLSFKSLKKYRAPNSDVSNASIVLSCYNVINYANKFSKSGFTYIERFIVDANDKFPDKLNFKVCEIVRGGDNGCPHTSELYAQPIILLE